MKYILILALFATSCTKQQSFVCEEQYTYLGKDYLNFSRTKEYTNRYGNTDALTMYNPMTGVIIWVKRSGVHVGVNQAKLYNTSVNFRLNCQ